MTSLVEIGMVDSYFSKSLGVELLLLDRESSSGFVRSAQDMSHESKCHDFKLRQPSSFFVQSIITSHSQVG